ncbi:MAG: hypothetical protein KAJ75_00015, partial [Alphaproteobacteria bacterium]|nr:hypothetical protein [Alphaproteobacteria bacterium]
MVNSKKHIQADIDRASHSTELNGSDEWVHLLPSGTFSGRDGRGPYVLNSSEDVIAKSSRIAGNSDLVVDYEHQT